MDSSNPTSRSNGLSLRDLLDERCIDPDLGASGKEEALQDLLELLGRSGKVRDEDAALQALLEREGQSSTGIGRGVAVPHAEIEGLARPVMALGISRSPIEYRSLDREPVHLVFLLLFPRGGSGLRMSLVGQVMRLMRNRGVREALRDSTTALEARAVLLDHLPQDGKTA